VARYRLRVQLIHWYELIVLADSSEDAVTKAEALSPRQIVSRGKCVPNGARTSRPWIG